MEDLIQTSLKDPENLRPNGSTFPEEHGDQLHLSKGLLRLKQSFDDEDSVCTFEGSIEQQGNAEHYHFDNAYKEGGNIAFYTPDNMKKRKGLREDSDIIEMLDKYYKTYRSRKNEERPGCVHKMEVTFVNVLICKALFDPEEFSVDDAWKAVEEDWEREARGESWMSEEQLKDSIFEIADLWTEDVEKASYVAMLEELYQCITKADDQRNQWKEIRSVSAMSSRSDLDGSRRQRTLSNVATQLINSGSFRLPGSLAGSGLQTPKEEHDGFGGVVQHAIEKKRNPWSIFRTVMILAGILSKKKKNQTSESSLPVSKEDETGHLSEWGAVTTVLQSTAHFMDHLHEKLNISKPKSALTKDGETEKSKDEETEKSGKQRQEPEISPSKKNKEHNSSDSAKKLSKKHSESSNDDPSKRKVVTGKLQGGGSVHLKQGQRLELSKHFQFPGTKAKIGISTSKVWDHLDEGDEILLGFPHMKTKLRLAEKTDESLFVIVGHNALITDNETLYIEGFSSTQKPQLPTGMDNLLMSTSQELPPERSKSRRSSLGRPRRPSRQPLVSLSGGSEATRDFISLDGHELPSALRVTPPNPRLGSPRYGSPRLQSPRTNLAPLKNEDASRRLQFEEDLAGYPAIVEVGGSLNGVVGKNMTGANGLGGPRRGSVHSKENNVQLPMKVRVMNKPVPFKPSSSQKQRFGMYGARARRTSTKENSGFAVKPKEFMEVMISNNVQGIKKGSIAKGSALKSNRSPGNHSPTTANAFPVLAGLAATTAERTRPFNQSRRRHVGPAGIT